MTTYRSTATVPQRRIFLSVLLVFVLFATLALSAGAALGQTTSINNLGCWGHFTGGGDQRSTATNRIRDEVTWVGGSMTSPRGTLLANPFSLLRAWQPPQGAAPPPIVVTSIKYMPIVFNGWNFSLSRLCS